MRRMSGNRYGEFGVVKLITGVWMLRIIKRNIFLVNQQYGLIVVDLVNGLCSSFREIKIKIV